MSTDSRLRIPVSRFTRYTPPFLRRGSPPVIRTLLIPIETNTLVTRSISSKERRSADGSQRIDALSGMQNKHAKLHRSVTEILSLAAVLPFVSTRSRGTEASVSKLSKKKLRRYK